MKKHRDTLLEQLENQGKLLQEAMPQKESMKEALKHINTGGVDAMKYAQLLQDLDDKNQEILGLQSAVAIAQAQAAKQRRARDSDLTSHQPGTHPNRHCPPIHHGGSRVTQ